MTQLLAQTKKKTAFYASKKAASANLQRRADTRTKIQLGGLVIKSGLTEVFSITTGDDLQLDVDGREKAMLLLGALIEMSQNIATNSNQKAGWKAIGQSAFAKDFLDSREKT